MHILVSSEQELRKSLLHKIPNANTQKWMSNLHLIRQSFYGNLWKSLHEESLGNTLTVPLRDIQQNTKYKFNK